MVEITWGGLVTNVFTLISFHCNGLLIAVVGKPTCIAAPQTLSYGILPDVQLTNYIEILWIELPKDCLISFTILT